MSDASWLDGSASAPPAGAGPLEVRIDELVLEGVRAHEAPAVAEALRAELARLLAEAGAGARAPGRAWAPDTAAAVPGDPRALGEAAARAVHQAIQAAFPSPADRLAIPARHPAMPASPRAGAGAEPQSSASSAGPGITAGDRRGGVA